LNLERWREKAGLRSPFESLAIKHCIWQWGLLSPEHRNPSTQGELAKALGVRRSYVGRILKRMFLDAPFGMLSASPVTPAHVISMRQRHQQHRHQQDEQARAEAERWEAAWWDQEAKARWQGYWPDQVVRNECDAYLADSPARASGPGQDEVRRIVRESDPEDRELCRKMFPWLKL
jgi:hypothetical protein